MLLCAFSIKLDVMPRQKKKQACFRKGVVSRPWRQGLTVMLPQRSMPWGCPRATMSNFRVPWAASKGCGFLVRARSKPSKLHRLHARAFVRENATTEAYLERAHGCKRPHPWRTSSEPQANFQRTSGVPRANLKRTARVL